MKIAHAVLGALMLAAGCAHNGSFESSMNRQLNILSYDEAIQTWGPPSSVAEGDRVIVARWRKPGGAETLHTGGYSFTNARSRSLTITFGKETKRMISWSAE